VLAEARRPPAAIPKGPLDSHGGMRTLAAVRRSELSYRRALQHSVAHNQRVRASYGPKVKRKKGGPRG
jgi:hypothetical protein